MYLQQISVNSTHLSAQQITTLADYSLNYSGILIYDSIGHTEQLITRHEGLMFPVPHAHLGLNEEVFGFSELIRHFTDELGFDDRAYIAYDQLITEILGYEDDLNKQLTRIVTALVKYGLNEEVVNQAEFYQLVALTYALTEHADLFKYAGIVDTIGFFDAIVDATEKMLLAIDTVAFSETSTAHREFLTLITDDYALEDDSANNIVAYLLAQDEIGFLGGIGLGGIQYTAYAVNTESSGISQFDDYAFNSFSYPLACAADGIYQLDDVVGGVDCSIRTGIMDFSSALKKQVPWVYLGIAQNGRVLLKTISSDRGVKKERWYEALSHTACTDTTRVQLGKGVKARYWQFELQNIDGEVFSLESMELLPLILKRRKQ